MSIEDDKTDEKPPVQQTVGKQWAGQKFAPVMTIEAVIAQAEMQKQYDHPDAVTLAIYLTMIGVRDPVMAAAMTGYTNVRKATKEAFDLIFKTF